MNNYMDLSRIGKAGCRWHGWGRGVVGGQGNIESAPVPISPFGLRTGIGYWGLGLVDLVLG